MNTDFLNIVTDSLAHIDPILGGGVAGVLVLGLVGFKIAKSKKKKTRQMDMTTNSIEGNGNNVAREFKRAGKKDGFDNKNTKEFEREMEGLTLQTQEFEEPISKKMNMNPPSIWDKPSTQELQEKLQRKTILPHPDLKSSDLIKAAIGLDNEGKYDNASHYLLEAIKIEDHEKEKLRLRLIAQHYKNSERKPGSTLSDIVEKLPTFLKAKDELEIIGHDDSDEENNVDNPYKTVGIESNHVKKPSTREITGNKYATNELKHENNELIDLPHNVSNKSPEEASFASFLKSEDHFQTNESSQPYMENIEGNIKHIDMHEELITKTTPEKSWLDEQADLAEEKLLHETGSNKEKNLVVDNKEENKNNDNEAASLKAEYPWLNNTNENISDIPNDIPDERYTETPVVPESKTHDRELINLDGSDLSSFQLKPDPVSGGLNLSHENQHILPSHVGSFPELIEPQELAPLQHEHKMQPIENVLENTLANTSAGHYTHQEFGSLELPQETIKELELEDHHNLEHFHTQTHNNHESIQQAPTELEDFMEKLAREAEEQDRVQQEQDQLEKEKFFKEFGSVIGDLKKEVSPQPVQLTHKENDVETHNAPVSVELEESQEPKVYLVWVNWMLQAAGKATMKESTFELEHAWGTVQAVQQLKVCLDKEAGVATSGVKNTWAVLSVFPLK